VMVPTWVGEGVHVLSVSVCVCVCVVCVCVLCVCMQQFTTVPTSTVIVGGNGSNLGLLRVPPRRSNHNLLPNLPVWVVITLQHNLTVPTEDTGCQPRPHPCLWHPMDGQLGMQRE